MSTVTNLQLHVQRSARVCTSSVALIIACDADLHSFMANSRSSFVIAPFNNANEPCTSIDRYSRSSAGMVAHTLLNELSVGYKDSKIHIQTCMRMYARTASHVQSLQVFTPSH
mmetsp:Transcript_3356/g.4551  ORF Transcript_3356/g.4551 Transcript_3356/m.4551 type:complete len:113 (-) Transcript_3356:713-1051(-)